MSKAAFNRIMLRHGFENEVEIWRRYLGVFHMTTAAIGAEKFYTTENNPARRESIPEARKLDTDTRNAWLGHPHLSIIDNKGKTFEQKLLELFKSICRVLGIPVPLEIEQKYLVGDFSLKGIPHQSVSIEQMYLSHGSTGDGTERRIRKRGMNGVFTYYLTTKEHVRSGVRTEIEHEISRREYEALSALIISHSNVIRKRRTCFLHEGQYFEFDQFGGRHDGLMILEIELTEEARVPQLPPFFKLKENVTDNPKFTNFYLATH